LAVKVVKSPRRILTAHPAGGEALRPQSRGGAIGQPQYFDAEQRCRDAAA
jgi:hypothetical protein